MRGQNVRTLFCPLFRDFIRLNFKHADWHLAFRRGTIQQRPKINEKLEPDLTLPRALEQRPDDLAFHSLASCHAQFTLMKPLVRKL